MSRFDFKTKRFSILHHQVSSLYHLATFLVKDLTKERVIILPVNENNPFLESHLSCAYWSQTCLCIPTCSNVYAGYEFIFQTRTIWLRLSVSENIQLTLRWAVLFLRQGGFRFSTITFFRHQLAVLFVEEMVKRKVIVFPVKENNTFLKVI